MKDVAFDGSIDFRRILSIVESSGNRFKIYPNPFQQYYIVEYRSERIKRMNVELYNLHGILLKRDEITFQPGLNYYRPTTRDLLYGAYYLRFDNDHFKLIKSE